MRAFVVGLVCVAGAILASESIADPANGNRVEARVFGAGVSAADTMLVSQLLANPDAYVGKVVRVQGIAVDVCAHRGCWVNISSDVEGEVVRLKVTDGEIVFPAAIMGDVITAEGVWTANELDLETTKMVCAYEAETKGEAFDPNSVTSCKTLYQITGTGASVVPASASGADPGSAPTGHGTSSEAAQPENPQGSDR